MEEQQRHGSGNGDLARVNKGGIKSVQLQYTLIFHGYEAEERIQRNSLCELHLET